MQKNPEWKQTTPIMEHISIRMSLEGHYSNWKSGITKNSEFSVKLKQSLDMLRDLEPFLAKGTW